MGYISHSAFNTQTINALGTYAVTPNDRVTFKVINNWLFANLAVRQSLNQFEANPFQRGCAVATSAAFGCGTVNLFANGFSGATVAQTAEQAGSSVATIPGASRAYAGSDHFDDQTTWRTQAVFDDKNINQPTGARACFGGRRKRGQNDQALGRSRGGFSTKIHLKVDLGGLPLAFHLTGGEASDSRNFESFSISDPTSRPALPSRIRDTMPKPIAMAPANAASVRSSHTNQKRSIDRHSFRKYSTRRGHASSRPSANSSASNASHSDARRPRKTTLPS